MPEGPGSTHTPDGAGLALGKRETSDEIPRRSGDDLIDAAGAGAPLHPSDQVDLLDYYLTNAGLPGDDDPVPVEFTIGQGKGERKDVWDVRTITWEEYQDAVDQATDEKTGERDVYVTASWVVARALIKPQLGPVVLRQQAEAQASADGKIPGPDGARIKPPSDAAQLLRRMFAKQSGILLELSGEVLAASKLGINGTGGVRTLDREVAAGKA